MSQADQVRQALRESFPGKSFAVFFVKRVSVRWCNGPTAAEVQHALQSRGIYVNVWLYRSLSYWFARRVLRLWLRRGGGRSSGSNRAPYTLAWYEGHARAINDEDSSLVIVRMKWETKRLEAQQVQGEKQ